MSKKERIIELRHQFPLHTLQEIGDKVEVSRQYVRKVLYAEGLHTSVPRTVRRPRQCKYCKTFIKAKKAFCNKECRLAYCDGYYKCSFCHVQFMRKRAEIMLSYRRGFKNLYCSNSCYNKGQKDIHT